MTDHITIPRALLEQALETINSFAALSAELAKPVEQVEAITTDMAVKRLEPVEPSYTATQLAAMVLSDCGISTDCTMLHERVARRIAKHEDELIENLQKLAKRAIPAWHDAPSEPGLWVQRSNLGSALEYVRHEDMGAQNWRGRWFGPIPQDKEGGAA